MKLMKSFKLLMKLFKKNKKLNKVIIQMRTAKLFWMIKVFLKSNKH